MNSSLLSVRLPGTDCDGCTGGRLAVGEITIGGTSSVTLAAPDFTDVGIGNAFDGVFPKVSEALPENVCGAREGPMGGDEAVTGGTGTERPPGRSDGEAGLSEARSVCELLEGSFAGDTSVTGGEGTEEGRSVTRDTGD